MKESIEDQFKSALEKYELPYNESAWASMNQKLDQLNTLPKPSTINNTWKWVTGGAITLTTICALVYTLSTQNDANGPVKNTISSQPQSSTEASQTSEIQRTVINPTIKNSNTTLSSTQKEVISQRTIPNSSVIKGEQMNKYFIAEKSTASNGLGTGNASCGTYISTLNTPAETPNSIGITCPEVKDFCYGEGKSIRNSNENHPLYIIHPNGSLTEILAHQSIYFKPTESGTHYLSIDGKTKNGEFYVRPLEKVELTVDESIKYEDGLPTTIVSASTLLENSEWTINGKMVAAYDSKMVAHLYNRGTHTITLKGKDLNGCEVQKSKAVRMEEDYNLLAPMAFAPESSDPRKNHFIPYALTVRNTAFKMIIIDPKSGAVVFETTSAEGWNGIDRTTNQLSEINKQYIWKVTLMNPEEGEPREYKGIVVRL